MLDEVGPGLLTTSVILRTLKARNELKNQNNNDKKDKENVPAGGRIEMKEVPGDDVDVIELERVIIPPSPSPSPLPLPSPVSARIRAAIAAAQSAASRASANAVAKR